MTSLVGVEWYELWNGEERGMTWICKGEIGNIYGTFKSFVRLEMSS